MIGLIILALLCVLFVFAVRRIIKRLRDAWDAHR